ncbi:MAG: hypothetical protein PHO08_13705 [Methylococcales bacterium]|nr:hypothetical protein [Methylococcales bacterium]
MIIRNKSYSLLATAICMAAVSFPTHAWRSYGGGSWSGRFGGSGSWSHSSAGGAFGGWGHGSGTYTGPHGNTANWSHTSYGGYHPPAYGGYHGWGYHPPYYSSGYSGGDVAAAGIAGLAVGAMAGAAAASQPPPAPTTVVVEQPMAPPTMAMALGTTLSYLPGNCVNINISSGQYYECGINWFKPYFGSNGAYYQVVPSPY